MSGYVDELVRRKTLKDKDGKSNKRRRYGIVEFPISRRYGFSLGAWLKWDCGISIGVPDYNEFSVIVMSNKKNKFVTSHKPLSKKWIRVYIHNIKLKPKGKLILLVDSRSLLQHQISLLSKGFGRGMVEPHIVLAKRGVSLEEFRYISRRPRLLDERISFRTPILVKKEVWRLY